MERVDAEVPEARDKTATQCGTCGASFSGPQTTSDGDHGHVVVALEPAVERLTQNGETWHRIDGGDWVKGERPAWLTGDDDGIIPPTE